MRKCVCVHVSLDHRVGFCRERIFWSIYIFFISALLIVLISQKGAKNCITTYPGRPDDSMWLAIVTSSDQMSYCHFFRPRTPLRTNPEWTPIRMSSSSTPVSERIVLATKHRVMVTTRYCVSNRTVLWLPRSVLPWWRRQVATKRYLHSSERFLWRQMVVVLVQTIEYICAEDI